MRGFATGIDAIVGILIFSVTMIGAIAAYSESSSSLTYSISSGYTNLASNADMQRFIYLAESSDGIGNALLSNTTYAYRQIRSNWSYNGTVSASAGRVLVLNGRLYGMWWDR